MDEPKYRILLVASHPVQYSAPLFRLMAQQPKLDILGAMDALHIAAAVSVGATEFITNEKPEKSIHRTPSIQIISIHPRVSIQ